MLQPINMFWLGGKLGPIERTSVASFLTAGHPVKLHAYDELEGLPDGAQLVDANVTASREMALSLRHKKTGSYALAGDYFRLMLQRQGAGIWSDLDVICLKPFDLPQETVFGWENSGMINNAVLRLPPASPILSEMLRVFHSRVIPEWMKPHRRRQLLIRRLFFIKWDTTDMPWGTTGPSALTYLAWKHGATHYASPIPVFYPVPFENAADLLAPDNQIERFIREETRGVHLWNAGLDREQRLSPPPSSYIGKMARRFGV